MDKRKLLEEMPQEWQKEVENLKEEVRPTSKKTKFERKATEDKESNCRSDEEMDLRTILIDTFLVAYLMKNGFENYSDRYISYFFEMFNYFSNFTIFFQVKINGGKLSRSRERTFASRGKA